MTKQSEIDARKKLEEDYNFSIPTHRDVKWDGRYYADGDMVTNPVELVKEIYDEMPSAHSQYTWGLTDDEAAIRQRNLERDIAEIERKHTIGAKVDAAGKKANIWVAGNTILTAVVLPVLIALVVGGGVGFYTGMKLEIWKQKTYPSTCQPASR